MSMQRLRVAVIADYAEEGWPSMDLVAEMLMTHLAREHAETIDAHLVRPPMRRRLTRVRALAGSRRFKGLDPVAARLWDYPPALARPASRVDGSHLVA